MLNKYKINVIDKFARADIVEPCCSDDLRC